MDISLVLAVYNNLDYTKDCYDRIREIYPNAPMVISSGGSTDGTLSWLESLDDDFLSYMHDDDKLCFSDNYNSAIKLVDTEKLVLIHNDMVIGENFLENLSGLIDEKTLLSYTTIEPPIFKGHKRAGKVILDLGSSFHDFKYDLFNQYVERVKQKKTLVNGASFFMSGYKSMFEDVGFFDGFSFDPFFCEDDDFLIRAKLKGYNLKTTECAVTYHFVSKTSRVLRASESKLSEHKNIRNFIRKWGIPIPIFNELYYWEDNIFNYKTFSMGLTTRNSNRLYNVEPYFDKIDLGTIPEDYISNEQPNTNYDLRSKFILTDIVDVMITETSPFTDEDLYTINKIRLSIPHYEVGEYQIGNMLVEIKRRV
jgi:GT2 family glycosyltransferase|tara:strand:+ start:317 stop:1414 length:1098 start_codon:yes stop_codon:yes gene_type:complete